jgi:hypothetical protein
MPHRTDRLKNLLQLQQQLKTFHEMRHAGYRAEARAAGEEAAEIMRRADAPNSLADLFPEVYARAIEASTARQEASTQKAEAEAGRIATETVRTNMVERSYRDARIREERETADKERLEALQRRRPKE